MFYDVAALLLPSYISFQRNLLIRYCSNRLLSNHIKKYKKKPWTHIKLKDKIGEKLFKEKTNAKTNYSLH